MIHEKNAHEIIDAFLENFNYIHKKGKHIGKRTGFRFSHFNKELTTSLETIAANLVAELNAIKDSSQDEAQKKRELINKIEQHIEISWQERDRLAPVSHHAYTNIPDFQMGGPPTHLVMYDSQCAYKNGNFEKECIKGLQKVSALLDGHEKERCEDLIKQIRKYQPIPVTRNYRTMRI